MDERTAAIGTADHRRFGAPTFYGLALLIVFVAYLVVLKLSSNGDWAAAGRASLINLLSLAILAAPVQLLLRNFVIDRKAWLQLAAHLALAPLFSLLWYWLLMVLIGLSGGDSITRFSVRPFFGNRATAWQLLQGVTLYALLAAITYARARQQLPSFVVAPPPPTADQGKAPSLSRYFLRRGEEIYPVDVSQIVSIAGADDYAEVATLTERHLVRMTLADFERALDGGTFIRVHRSRIVNTDRIVRAEPAGGGRVILHMEDGEIVQASRAGTRLLRDRVL